MKNELTKMLVLIFEEIWKLFKTYLSHTNICNIVTAFSNLQTSIITNQEFYSYYDFGHNIKEELNYKMKEKRLNHYFRNHNCFKCKYGIMLELININNNLSLSDLKTVEIVMDYKELLQLKSVEKSGTKPLDPELLKTFYESLGNSSCSIHNSFTRILIDNENSFIERNGSNTTSRFNRRKSDENS
ncbi:PIR protein [Plasmodium brasilianum]|uniref:PIR protein n=1 Tax=Plasmodium brasilianum TaxID=5824 RepID=A0ACB9YD31_PLABR|nr:PIR protein [Plasmodium brasilianum]